MLPVEMRDEDENAILYAVNLARSSGASIVLCHTFVVPVPPTEVPVVAMPVEEIRESNQKALEEYARQLQSSYPDVSFDFRIKADDVEHGVAAAAAETGADIIVMGLSENDIGSFVFGHNAMGVVNHSDVPVLMLPTKAAYKPLRKVLLACDLLDLSSRNVFQPLHKLLKIYDPELLIVHVVEEEGKLPKTSEAVAGLRLDQLFSESRHSFHFPVNEDVVKGINEFAAANHVDLVVSVHHPRGFFRRLFTTVHTRQMSFSINTPLLVLHG